MFRFFNALLVACTLSACATAVRGVSEDVSLQSNPPGAEVKTTLGHACITPCSIKVNRRDTFTATFTLGEKTQSIFVDTVVAEGAAAIAGNALVGGAIGVGVDIATGAGLDHTPNPVIARFDGSAPPVQTALAKAEPSDAPNASTSAPVELVGGPDTENSARNAVSKTAPSADAADTHDAANYGGFTTPGLTEDSTTAERKCRPWCS